MFREHGAVEYSGLVTAVEQAADGIVITDPQGLIQYVNPAFTAMTGYTREEAVGQHTRILKSGSVPPERYEELWSTVRSGKTWAGALVNRRKDGSFYNEEMRINPVLDAQGEVVSYIAIKHDVTERMAGEEARQFLSAIVESSREAIIAATLEGNILTWNRGAETLFGYTAEEAVGMHISTLVPPGRQLNLAHKVAQACLGIAVHENDGLGLCKDGRIVHVSVSGSPIANAAGKVVAISAIVRDISDRHEAERTQSLLASIIESSGDAIYCLGLDGTIVSWNRGAEKLFGYSDAEIMGKDSAILFPPGRGEELRWRLETIRKGVVIAPFETVLQAKDGGAVSASVSISPIRNAAGETVGVAAIVRNISERLRTEGKLLESEERFRQVFEHAPFGLAATALDGTILEVNPALCRMLGYSEGELVGEHWAKVAHPDDLEACQRNIELWLRKSVECWRWKDAIFTATEACCGRG